MGLFDLLRPELIDIIEWTSQDQETLVWKFPRIDNEIKNGAQLIVREGQTAVFLFEGQLGDVFGPGRHTLKTQNIPILSTLKGWKYGFDSPFKCDVFFVSTKLFTNQKWGTKNPIMHRDAEFGPIRLRAFGTYAFKVSKPGDFIKYVSGAGSDFSVSSISDQLRNLAVTRGMDAIAESKIPALDLAMNYDEVSNLITQKIQPEFGELGLELSKFLIENVSFPPEVEEALDKRSKMSIIGNLNQYSQFQAANAIEEAAQNAGVSGMMGMGILNNMGMMGQTQAQAPSAPMQAPPPLIANIFLAIQGAQSGPFDQGAIMSMLQSGQINGQTLAWKQGMAAWAPAQNIPELAPLFAQVPPPLPIAPPIPPQA